MGLQINTVKEHTKIFLKTYFKTTKMPCNFRLCTLKLQLTGIFKKALHVRKAQNSTNRLNRSLRLLILQHAKQNLKGNLNRDFMRQMI